MSVVPSKPLLRIEFYENHIDGWVTNSTAIGLVTATTTSLQAKITAARNAYVAHQAAQQAAKVATEAFNQALSAMTIEGAGAMKTIRGKAETSGNPAVYTLAAIPAPATPTPKGPPGEVTNVKVALGATGALTLTWKCKNPAGAQGTMYQVWRKLDNETISTYLGGSGDKKFVDDTIPAGTSKITYQFQAVRSTAVGPDSTFNVTFGNESNGTFAVSVEKVAPTKLAA